MDQHIKKNKHTSTLIRKKYRKRPQYRCCGKVKSYNVTKPMKGKYFCTTVKFYKSRNKMVQAKQEIRDLMK